MLAFVLDYWDRFVSLELTVRVGLAVFLGGGVLISYASGRLIFYFWRLFGERDEWLGRSITCGFALMGLLVGLLMITVVFIAPLMPVFPSGP